MTTLAIFSATVLFALLCVWQLVGFLVAWKFLFSDHHQLPHRETPGDRGIDSLELIIPVDNTHHVVGWLLTPEQRVSLGGACIVMVHGFDSSKDKRWIFDEDANYNASMLDQGAESLWRAGFHVVAIDLRNHGDSPNNGPTTLGADESEDVLATLRFLVNNAAKFGIDPTRIGLRGESMGGATCMIAAAKDKQNHVAALWSDSAFADAGNAIMDFMPYKGIPVIFAVPARFWLVRLAGVDLKAASPIAFLDQIDCPVFLTHSSSDSMLPTRHLDSLASADGWKIQPESWLVDGHQHNRLWREPSYHKRQIDFFRRTLAASQQSLGRTA